jgi:DNA primase
MSVVDEVRERSDIVEIVGGSVQLKKAGRTLKGLCPFHQERTPSFVVYPDSGTWRCFGACATGGDVFSFVMRAENLDFRGALELLARRAGVTLEAPSAAAEARQSRLDRLHDAAAAAAAFYHRQLMRAPEAEAARAYLAARDFGGDVARLFELGWAPDAWSAVRDALHADGFSDEELLAAGLVRAREGGGAYDYFRSRLTIPIRDAKGRAIGFGARTLEVGGQPKYLNSSQSELFDKSHVLFGLDRAARAIRQAGEAVVVEGYTDVIRAHAAAYTNVVASLGTALTAFQLTALRRHARVIVLALDADAAGQAATLRGLEVAREALEGDVTPVPTAHGWIRYEHRLDVELKVATLPAGQDPDDVIRADPDTWRSLIQAAQPVMAFLFQTLTSDLDLLTPGGKSAAADRLLPLVSEIPDPVVRSAWLSRLAELIRVDEKNLAVRLAAPKPPRRTRRSEASPPPEADGEGVDTGQRASLPPPATSPSAELAGYVLSHLLAAPRCLRDVNARLREDHQPPLGPEDFDGATERDLFEAVRHAARGVPPPDAPPEHHLDTLPEAHAQVAAALRAQAAAAPQVSARARVEALREATLRLRIRSVNEQLTGLRHLQLEADADARAGFEAQVRDLGAQLLALQRLLPSGQAR